MEPTAAILLGLISSLHCIGMCGPIAMALPLDRSSLLTKTVGAASYNIGRFLSYVILGALFGVIGQSFFTAGLQRTISVVIGVLFVVSVVFPVFSKKGYNLEAYMGKYYSRLKSTFARQFKKKTYSALLLIGVLNGLLPCGMVYLGLAAAISTGHFLKGAELMLFFGLGTLPAMWMVSVIGDLVSMKFKAKMRKAIPVFVGVMGVLFILRGMNLNVPYLSPFIDRVTPEITVCD